MSGQCSILTSGTQTSHTHTRTHTFTLSTPNSHATEWRNACEQLEFGKTIDSECVLSVNNRQPCTRSRHILFHSCVYNRFKWMVYAVCSQQKTIKKSQTKQWMHWMSKNRFAFERPQKKRDSNSIHSSIHSLTHSVAFCFGISSSNVRTIDNPLDAVWRIEHTHCIRHEGLKHFRRKPLYSILAERRWSLCGQRRKRRNNFEIVKFTRVFFNFPFGRQPNCTLIWWHPNNWPKLMFVAVFVLFCLLFSTFKWNGLPENAQFSVRSFVVACETFSTISSFTSYTPYHHRESS